MSKTTGSIRSFFVTDFNLKPLFAMSRCDFDKSFPKIFT